MNALVITETDDDGGVKSSDVEEEPELPIGVSIKGLRKVFKVSNYCDINPCTSLLGLKLIK